MAAYLYLLIALTPFLAVSPWIKWHGVPTGIIYGGLAAAFVVGTIMQKPDILRWSKIRKTPLVLPMLVFAGINVLSAAWTIVVGGVKAIHLDGIQEMIYFLFATVFYWAMVHTIDTRQKINYAIQAFVIGAVTASLYGLTVFFTSLASNKFLASDLAAVRMTATAGEPQVFGGFLITILPLLAAAVLYRIHFTRPVFYYLGAVLLLFALTATFSAGALAGFGLAVILLLLFIPYYNFRQLVSFALIFVLAGSFIFILSETAFPGYLSVFKTVTYKYTAQIPAFDKLRDKGDTSFDGTYEALQKSNTGSEAIDSKYLPSVRSKVERSWFRAALWNMFKSSPVLGVGPGNFGFLYNSFRPPGSESPPYVPKPHNQYLQILAETGLAGALAFVWVLFGAAAKFFQSWLAASRENRKLLLGMAASLAAVGVHGYSFGILVHIQVWLMLAITVAFTVNINRQSGGRYR